MLVFGIYRKGVDEVSLNIGRRIAKAKKAVIDMYDAGYVIPTQRTDIKGLGHSGLNAMYAGVNAMHKGK